MKILPVRRGLALYSSPLKARTSSAGFTLIELLLGMGIIGSLSAIVIVALNPTHQFAQARNTQRRSDVKSILEAVQQYTVDHDSDFAEGIDMNWRMLGTAAAGCDVSCGEGEGGSDPVTVTLSPTADTYVNQGSAGTNYGTNTQLWTDPWTAGNAKRSLIRFDLSALPPGATITSADLHLLEADTQGTTRTVAIHRVTQDWTEGGVTWTNAASQYNAAATDSISVNWAGGIPTWDIWDVQGDVQDSIDGVNTDYGWLLKDTAEGTSQFRWQFHSRDAVTSGNRPFLEVVYDDGTVTESSCLDLSTNLVSTYLPAIPADPRYGSGGKTFYAVQSGGEGRLSVRACSAEEEEDIAVTR